MSVNKLEQKKRLGFQLIHKKSDTAKSQHSRSRREMFSSKKDSLDQWTQRTRNVTPRSNESKDSCQDQTSNVQGEQNAPALQLHKVSSRQHTHPEGVSSRYKMANTHQRRLTSGAFDSISKMHGDSKQVLPQPTLPTKLKHGVE